MTSQASQTSPLSKTPPTVLLDNLIKLVAETSVPPIPNMSRRNEIILMIAQGLAQGLAQGWCRYRNHQKGVEDSRLSEQVIASSAFASHGIAADACAYLPGSAPPLPSRHPFKPLSLLLIVRLINNCTPETGLQPATVSHLAPQCPPAPVDAFQRTLRSRSRFRPEAMLPWTAQQLTRHAGQ